MTQDRDRVQSAQRKETLSCRKINMNAFPVQKKSKFTDALKGQTYTNKQHKG